MIGQEKLLSRIDSLIARNTFPRFLILSGPKGSGKELVAKYIAKKLGGMFIYSGSKVDEIRDLIEESYLHMERLVYFIDNSDDLSVQAKNAILKVTEEPPEEAYFIMSTEDLQNVMITLKSRGTSMALDPYTPDQLGEYLKGLDKELDEKTFTSIINVCETPGDINDILTYNLEEFYNFADLVVENLGIVSGVNAFKIGNKIKFKDEGEGWDPLIFIRLVQYRAYEKLKEDYKLSSKYYDLNRLSGILKRSLTKGSANKIMNFDCWLLDVREALR